jgi:hypothetical protein
VCYKPVMTKKLTAAEQQEYARLFGEYRAAVNAAHEALTISGMESKAFEQADARVGQIWVKLRAMQGSAGKPWSD